MSERRRILFVQHAANLSGSAFSGLQICRAMVATGWQVDAAFASDGPAVELYQAAGCQTQVIPHRNWLSASTARAQIKKWMGEFQATLGFRSAMKRLSPDLVYVNSTVSASAMLAAKSLGLARIWHLRELFDDVGGELRLPPIGGRRLVQRVVNSLCDHAIAPSRAIIENVVGPAFRGTVQIIPNAADSTFFEAPATRGDWKLPAGATVIGVPGTLRPVKGHPFFIVAFAAIAKDHPTLHALIAGEESDAAYAQLLRALVEKHRLQSCMHFVGPVGDMRQFYCACDIVCVPSRSESFGRAIVEAFAMNVPVVASRVGGIGEIVDDEQTGLLVEYADVAGLSAALSRLLNNEQLRSGLAANARRGAEQRFHESAYTARILSIVQRVVPDRCCAERKLVHEDGVVLS